MPCSIGLRHKRRDAEDYGDGHDERELCEGAEDSAEGGAEGWFPGVVDLFAGDEFAEHCAEGCACCGADEGAEEWDGDEDGAGDRACDGAGDRAHDSLFGGAESFCADAAEECFGDFGTDRDDHACDDRDPVKRVRRVCVEPHVLTDVDADGESDEDPDAGDSDETQEDAAERGGGERESDEDVQGQHRGGH